MILNQLIQIVIPAGLVLYGMYLTTKALVKKHHQEKIIERGVKYTEITLPLRLQAYERMALFLERIHIHSLLIRVDHQKLDVSQLQHHLISEIRSEFSHNLAQQIYLSNSIWIAITQAKEQIISTVNHVAIKFESNKQKNTLDFMKQLLEENNNDNILLETLRLLKEEVRHLFI